MWYKKLTNSKLDGFTNTSVLLNLTKISIKWSLVLFDFMISLIGIFIFIKIPELKKSVPKKHKPLVKDLQVSVVTALQYIWKQGRKEDTAKRILDEQQ